MTSQVMDARSKPSLRLRNSLNPYDLFRPRVGERWSACCTRERLECSKHDQTCQNGSDHTKENERDFTCHKIVPFCF